MSFSNMILTIERESQEFDNLFNKYLEFAEASYNEYKINLKEAGLKVIKESGTAEDLIYLEKEASDGFIVRAGKTITKMVETFLTWLGNLINKIKDFLTGEKTKEAFSKAEKVIENNPKLKSEKIKVTDTEKVAKFYDKHDAMVDRKLAMFKAKKFSEKDLGELNEIENSYEKDKKTATKLTVGISIATALSMFGIILSKLEKQKKDMETLKIPTANTTDDPEQMEQYVGAYALKCRINKEKAKSLQNIIKELFNGLKSKITGSGEVDLEVGKKRNNKKEKSDDVKTESTVDELSYLDSLISEIEESSINVIESTEYSNKLDKYLTALEKEIFLENDEEVVTAEEYLTALESELFDDTIDEEVVTAEEYLESMEAELFDE